MFRKLLIKIKVRINTWIEDRMAAAYKAAKLQMEYENNLRTRTRMGDLGALKTRLDRIDKEGN